MHLENPISLSRTADGPRPQHVPTAMGLGKSIAFLAGEAAATGDRSRSGDRATVLI